MSRINYITEFFRNCPCYEGYSKCKKIVYYASKLTKDAAQRHNSLCVACNTKRQHAEGRAHGWKGEDNPFFGSHRSGSLNPFYGKHHTEDTKLRISISGSGINNHNYGKTWEEILGDEKSKIQKEKLRNFAFGGFGSKLKGKRLDEIYGKDKSDKIREKHSIRMLNNCPMKNIESIRKMVETRKLNDSYRSSPETNLKIRLKAIERIEKFTGISPRFNPVACKIIDEYGLKHNYNFQHALNEGEFRIKDLGYWVDGYDKDKNVVIEYYERHHYKSDEQLKYRDNVREQEIILALNCKFIRINAFDNNNLKYEILCE